jgi:ribonuclease HI
MYFDGSLKL